MQHFCAEMGELGSFAIGNFRNSARAGNEARIGGEHAIHVGPDDHFVGCERTAQNRGGIIGAAAAERGEHTFSCGADKSGDYRNYSLLQQRAKARFAAFPRGRPSEVRLRHDRNR